MRSCTVSFRNLATRPPHCSVDLYERKTEPPRLVSCSSCMMLKEATKEQLQQFLLGVTFLLVHRGPSACALESTRDHLYFILVSRECGSIGNTETKTCQEEDPAQQRPTSSFSQVTTLSRVNSNSIAGVTDTTTSRSRTERDNFTDDLGEAAAR